MKYATVALALFAATGLCSPRRQMPFDDDKPQICWRLCATEDLQCPENWVSIKQYTSSSSLLLSRIPSFSSCSPPKPNKYLISRPPSKPTDRKSRETDR